MLATLRNLLAWPVFWLLSEIVLMEDGWHYRYQGDYQFVAPTGKQLDARTLGRMESMVEMVVVFVFLAAGVVGRDVLAVVATQAVASLVGLVLLIATMVVATGIGKCEFTTT